MVIKLVLSGPLFNIITWRNVLIHRHFFLLRYASQEDGTWIRALLKDLTIEAGSGLVVLSPVDILGGYTSVKEKTNMSLSSTDIHLHLSLSVISLLLNLQNQVADALQFGDANPLTSCTNFERIWVSPKGIRPTCGLCHRDL